MYFHVLCTFELLLQDQDGTSSLFKKRRGKAVCVVKLGRFLLFSPSLLLIIFSVACVCLDGGGGGDGGLGREGRGEGGSVNNDAHTVRTVDRLGELSSFTGNIRDCRL